ncbi:MAG: peptide chain release factor N(5)-glutamine methyltransferase [Chloroflexia bacterium]
MTIDSALRAGTKRLSPCSRSPRLDAEVLLAHVIGAGRASLLARFSEPLDDGALAAFSELVERRGQGEPVAYLTGHKEFYGLDLLITRDVLVPRPETESAVDACLELLEGKPHGLLADIGTGSGAIMVAVAVRLPGVRVYGTEISPEALEVARINCERHGLGDRAQLYPGNLLEPLPTRVDVIAANLPYVPPGEAEPEVATWEPRVAVFGGDEDGTALIRQFLAAAPDYVLPGGGVVMEVAHSQGPAVAALAQGAFPGGSVEVRKDLAGYDRIVLVKTA